MDPEIVSLGIQLTDTALRNTASAIADRITAAKARKKDQETIAELEDIISSLISDKNDLVRIAQVYEQELAGQRISQSEVEYITGNLIPILKQLAAAGANEDGTDSGTERAIDAVASLLSVETVNILQLVGFNFKQAVGEPLTRLIAQLISSKEPSDAERNNELQALLVKRDIAYFNIAQDPEAYKRFRELSPSAS